MNPQHATTDSRSATSPAERVNGVHPHPTHTAITTAFIGKPLSERWNLRPAAPNHDQGAEDLKVKLDAELAEAVRVTGLMRRGFYIAVLLVALGGQVTGAVGALHIPLLAAVPAVAALELGGVVVMNNADVRRRLGEKAHASRILSAAIAAWAVAFNWLAHSNHLLGGFFAGMSALGYLVWLMHTENQRRDRLRAIGDLPPTTPAYELWVHWVRHPLLTMRAKSLAKQSPKLGLYGSVNAARAAVARERRTAAISKVLHRKIRAAVDPTTADIAVAVYDIDEIAGRLADGADYAGLTDLIAADLVPARLAPRPQVRPPKPAATSTDLLGHAFENAPPDAPADAFPAPVHTHPQTHPAGMADAPADALLGAVQTHPQTQSCASDARTSGRATDAPTDAVDRVSQTHLSASAAATEIAFSDASAGRTQPRVKRTPADAPLDAAKIRKLRAFATRNGGRVSERSVQKLLSCGAPKAKEYMAAVGLPFDDPTPPNGDPS